MIAEHQRLFDLLTHLSLEVRTADDGVWVGVPSRMRGTLAVRLVAGERSVRFFVFVMRAPEVAHHEVFHRMLRKNHGAGPWMFSLDELGDVYLVASVPAATLDADALDGLLGALSALVDEVFEGLVRTGFGVAPEVPLGPPPAAAT